MVNTMAILILGAIAILGVVLFVVFKSGAEQPASHGKKTSSANPSARYSSVSIMTPRSCCQAAQALVSSRFLVREAPQLPLEKCNLTHCKCGYIRHEDRRDDGGDRRAMYGLRSELHALHSGEERRHRRGRRAGDLAMA